MMAWDHKSGCPRDIRTGEGCTCSTSLDEVLSKAVKLREPMHLMDECGEWLLIQTVNGFVLKPLNEEPKHHAYGLGMNQSYVFQASRDLGDFIAEHFTPKPKEGKTDDADHGQQRPGAIKIVDIDRR